MQYKKMVLGVIAAAQAHMKGIHDNGGAWDDAA